MRLTTLSMRGVIPFSILMYAQLTNKSFFTAFRSFFTNHFLYQAYFDTNIVNFLSKRIRFDSEID